MLVTTHTKREASTHKAQRTDSGVYLPGAGTGAAILASMSLSRVAMRRSNLEFKTSMDLRKTGLSSAFAFIHSAFSARISAATASISSFNLRSCSSVLRSEVSLASTGVRGVREDVDRTTGPEGGGRPPEKKRAPRDEEGEDEDSE